MLPVLASTGRDIPFYHYLYTAWLAAMLKTI